MIDLNTLHKFANKKYRDGFLQAQVRGRIAYQIQALRRKFGLTQSEFAERTGKKQSVISRLENTEYGKVSVQTLLDIAAGLNVALVVQFVSFPEFLKRSTDMSDAALQPETIDESLARRQFLPAMEILSEHRLSAEDRLLLGGGQRFASTEPFFAPKGQNDAMQPWETMLVGKAQNMSLERQHAS